MARAPISKPPAASARSRAELAEDAASTKLVRAAGLRVRLVDAPFAQPLGRRAPARGVAPPDPLGAAAPRRAFRTSSCPKSSAARCCRSPALAFVASSRRPAGRGDGRGAFAALWYGAEMALAQAAGWHLPPLYPAHRGAARPAAAGALARRLVGTDFVWRGNAMSIAEPVRVEPALRRRPLTRAPPAQRPTAR